jgi:hypothetical protein
MTEFFSGHGTRITHDVFEVHSPSYEAFEIRGLSNLHAFDWDSGSAPTALVAFRLSCAAVGAAVLVSDWSIFHGASSTIAAVAVLAIAAVLCVRFAKARARTYELWSDYNGEGVRLFYTTDADAIAQVKHGLMRAMEHRVNH